MRGRLGINSWRFSLGRAKLAFEVRQRGFTYPSSAAGCFRPQNEARGCVPQRNTFLGPIMLLLVSMVPLREEGLWLLNLQLFSTVSAALRSFSAPKIGFCKSFQSAKFVEMRVNIWCVKYFSPPSHSPPKHKQAPIELEVWTPRFSTLTQLSVLPID